MRAGPEDRFGLPEFRIAIPEPWSLIFMTPEEQAKEDAKASTVFKSAGRPDLDAQFKMLALRSRRRMSQSNVFAVIRQQDIELDDFLPLAITLAKLESRDESSLDSFMAEQIHARNAAPLERATWAMHWVEDHVGDAELAGLQGRTLSYAIAAPETGRREAILISATISNPGLDNARPVFDALGFFVDALVRSFSWVPGTGQPRALKDQLRDGS